jgi:hypothetical protein
MFPPLARCTDLALLLVRLMVALAFAASGYHHLRSPAARATDSGMSKPFTIFLGTGEVAGGLGIAFGVLTDLPPVASSSSCSAPYVRHLEKDVRLALRTDVVLMNPIIAVTNGGAYGLMR